MELLERTLSLELLERTLSLELQERTLPLELLLRTLARVIDLGRHVPFTRASSSRPGLRANRCRARAVFSRLKFQAV